MMPEQEELLEDTSASDGGSTDPSGTSGANLEDRLRPMDKLGGDEGGQPQGSPKDAFDKDSQDHELGGNTEDGGGAGHELAKDLEKQQAEKAVEKMAIKAGATTIAPIVLPVLGAVLLVIIMVFGLAMIGSQMEGGVAVADPTEEPQPSNATIKKIIQIAEAELGTQESSGNCNPYGPCAPWCAYFVSWVYEKSGTPFAGGSIGAAIGIETYFKANEVWISDKSSPPKPGYTINYGNGYTHVDLVVAVDGDNVTTIGGNEGANGIVKKDTFNWRTKSIHGYGGFKELYE